VRGLAVQIVTLALGGSALGAAAASADSLNHYQAAVSASQRARGSAGAPAALRLTEQLTISPATDVNADPLTSFDLSLADVRSASAGFPTCTAAVITRAGEDTICPHGALLAIGELAGTVWSPAQPTVAGQACDAVIDVWNAGSGRLAYFPRVLAGHFCAGLESGEIPAWTGVMKQSGTTLSIDTRLPVLDSTDLGGTGLFSGLTSLELRFSPLTRKLGHRTIPFLGSIGCAPGGRRYSVAFTASGVEGSDADTITASAAC
jgi:hypothetical protein